MQKITKTILSLFSVLLLAGGFFAFGSNVHAASINAATSKATDYHYVIQLNNSDASILKALPGIVDIEPLFVDKNTDEDFANTYKFQSQVSLPVLQATYTGNYKYLDYDLSFTDTKTKSKSTKSGLPNDPGFSSDKNNIDRQWGLWKAEFVKAWEKTTGDKDTIIAVIDTGIDGTHEDLRKTKIVSGYNILTQRAISGHANSDDNGHGTLISGVIAATANNDKGVAGAAYGVSLMPVKALDSDGTGSSSDISAAIVWAADNNADVINLSLGGMGFAHNTVLANAISYAFNKNVVIVAAAGNDVAVTGGNLDEDPVFPICNDNNQNMVIGVTASDVKDLKPNFANFGKACVDVSAPGKRILTTANHDPSTGSDSPDAYAYASGTSLAVPFVSAQAGLLRSLYPSATNKQIRDRIILTADNIDQLNLSQCAGGSCKGYLGARINAAKSLEQQIITLEDGDVVNVNDTSEYYYINGGKKQLISPFVRSQRFAASPIKLVTKADLKDFQDGSYAVPNDGTLVKSPNDSSVYYIQSGLRRPLTWQVFLMRGFKTKDIVTLTNVEINSWVEGSFLSPLDGSVVRSTLSPPIYWVVNGVLHPVNYKFYIDRGLNTFPITYMSESDIAKFTKGDALVL